MAHTIATAENSTEYRQFMQFDCSDSFITAFYTIISQIIIRDNENIFGFLC